MAQTAPDASSRAAGRTNRQPPRAARTPSPAPAAPPPSADPRFAHGPLAVLDADGSAYCVDGLILDCPAKTLPALVDWALNEAKLGAPRLHRHGKDADPLVVLTAPAAERLGLPGVLEDRRGLRLPADHKVVKQLTRAKWQLTRRGFGPWPRVYRPAEGGRRQCVQLAILPWGALDARSWGDTDQLPPAELARVLGSYATRVITPRGSTAVCGLELMTALRPPTRPVKDEATGAWVAGPNPGSLTAPVDPAPPEAPNEHPVVAASCPRHHERTPDQVLDEEAYDWFRPLTDEECAQGYAYGVGIDVNMAFAAAANRLTVGIGPATHVHAPDFDAKLPGGKARTNMHRKMTRLAAVGRFPVAVLSDCAVYLSHGPSPRDFLPYTPEGTPLPGGFRLGVSPGMVKHEGTQDFLWVASMIEDEQINPARHIKGADAAADGE
ncbi:hypothetical protein AB0C96_36865 [Streptomyces sp. NPDC048506]|uniref:hypothetical protein n=1 Tax=Streptomyces sp. NPDC048506 TaxID=3155028 RepID=UPI00343AB08C